jgi:large subunit ribosomal protein L33
VCVSHASCPPPSTMAKAKARCVTPRLVCAAHTHNLASTSRTIIVRLVSTAQTGFFYTTMRPRVAPRLSALKYDPKGAWRDSSRQHFTYAANVLAVKAKVLFVEDKKSKKK